MGAPRLYIDEDVYQAVAVGLRRRGFDVLTTVEADRRGASDEGQLRFAVAERRTILTFNRGDFARLHAAWLTSDNHRFGILVAPQSSVGAVVRRVSCLLADHQAEELADRLIWLAGL